MIKWIVSTVVVVAAWATFGSTSVGALSLKIAPLEYNATLEKAEIKKGYVDISNPESKEVTVNIDVLAFRQIDNDGSLEFYEDEQVAAGVKLDFRSIKLGPREALRVYFLLDGTKLPTGDVFAAIMASIKPPEGEAAAQSVRVGTILQIVNGTPGARGAEITKLDVPFLQLSEQLQGTYWVKNTADANKSSGFSPEVEVSLVPFVTSQTVESSLVFAGRERPNDFALDFGRFGIYRVDVTYGDSTKSSWVFLVTWQGVLIVFAVILGIVAATLLWRKYAKNVKFTTRRK